MRMLIFSIFFLITCYDYRGPQKYKYINKIKKQMSIKINNYYN